MTEQVTPWQVLAQRDFDLFWASLLFSAIGSSLWLGLAPPYFHAGWQAPRWYWAAVYGMLIGIAGLIGDLCESLIKRDARVKDI